MRTPKAPAGFVPVDSEEARGIDDNEYVNYSFMTEYGTWYFDTQQMHQVRRLQRNDPNGHRHVQLPPPVEWEEVWGWGEVANYYLLTKHGETTQDNGFLKSKFTPANMDTIVRALNEMEGRDG